MFVLTLHFFEHVDNNINYTLAALRKVTILKECNVPGDGSGQDVEVI